MVRGSAPGTCPGRSCRGDAQHPATRSRDARHSCQRRHDPQEVFRHAAGALSHAGTRPCPIAQQVKVGSRHVLHALPTFYAPPSSSRTPRAVWSVVQGWGTEGPCPQSSALRSGGLQACSRLPRLVGGESRLASSTWKPLDDVLNVPLFSMPGPRNLCRPRNIHAPGHRLQPSRPFCRPLDSSYTLAECPKALVNASTVAANRDWAVSEGCCR